MVCPEFFQSLAVISSPLNSSSFSMYARLFILEKQQKFVSLLSEITFLLFNFQNLNKK